MSNRLGDLISSGEGGYNSYNRGSAGDARGATIDFSRMTLGEIQDQQHLARRDPDRLFAVGKYQVIPDTMDGAARGLRLDRNERFTPDLQERIFSDYLISQKRPDIRGYITGNAGVSRHDAQEAVAAEWASVADPDTGRSKYGGVGNNRASVSADAVGRTLDTMRNEYRAQVDGGMSPENAWKSVTGRGQGQQQETLAPKPANADGLLEQGEKGTDVRQLQERLNALGQRDAQGHALKPDGDFGAHTKESVQAFQRAQGLEVDGIAGPKTIDALQKVRQAPLLSDASHPNHAMYEQAVAGLEKLGPQAGFKNRQELERAAGAMVFEARASGLTQIDHVAQSTNGAGLFAVQGGLNDPAHQRVYLDKAQAASQPLEQSTTLLQQDTQRQAQERPATQAPTQEPSARTLNN